MKFVYQPFYSFLKCDKVHSYRKHALSLYPRGTLGSKTTTHSCPLAGEGGGRISSLMSNLRFGWSEVREAVTESFKREVYYTLLNFH